MSARAPNGRYAGIVRAINALPPKRPRPAPEPVRFNVAKLRQRVHDLLSKPVVDAAEDLYRIALVHALGTQSLEDAVPVSRVPGCLSGHVGALVQASVDEGATPFHVYFNERYRAFIDYGEGRVLELRVQLHNPTHVKEETVASIIVEEGELPADPWHVFYRQ